jgi:peptidoglycan/LPS O-acetylase OafA/YrhL
VTESRATPAANRHLPHLDGLRALAAIFVVLHHAVLQVDFSAAPLSPVLKKLIRPLYYGHYAVDLFIVLSGFCLMIPVLRGDGTLKGGVLQFFKRRAWRILPAYYFAVAFSLLLIWGLVGQKTGTHWDISLPVTAKGIWTHLTMTHDIVGEDFSINHVLWSIAVECRMYLLFPLLLLLWRRIGPLATLGVAGITSFGLFVLCGRTIGATLHFHYLGLFTMGMFAAAVAFSPERRLRQVRELPWGLGTLLAAFVFVAALVVGKGRGEIAVELVDYTFGFLSMAFLVMVSRDARLWITRLLGWRPLVFVGTFAYSIYLIHAPLLQVFWQYPLASLQAKPLTMFLALSTLGTLAILVIAYLFFLAFERPFLRRRKFSGNPDRILEKPAHQVNNRDLAED